MSHAEALRKLDLLWEQRIDDEMGIDEEFAQEGMYAARRGWWRPARSSFLFACVNNEYWLPACKICQKMIRPREV